MKENRYDTLTDEELVILFSEGNDRAFAVLHDRYFDRLYLHAYRMLKDQEQSKDTIQEVFTKMVVNRSTLYFHTGLANYLYTAVRNKVLDYMRQQQTRDNYLSYSRISEEAPAADERYILQQLSKQIQQGLEELPKESRESFEMNRFQEMSYEQIAKFKGVSVNTIKKQISHSLKILRRRVLSLLF